MAKRHHRDLTAHLLGVILGECPELTAVLAGTLTGQETQRAVTRAFKLAVRHFRFFLHIGRRARHNEIVSELGATVRQPKSIEIRR